MAYLLSGLYCYLIGYGDYSVGKEKESGNGHLINSFPRRRQQKSALTMSYLIEQDSCQSLDQIARSVCFFQALPFSAVLTHRPCTLFLYNPDDFTLSQSAEENV